MILIPPVVVIEPTDPNRPTLPWAREAVPPVMIPTLPIPPSRPTATDPYDNKVDALVIQSTLERYGKVASGSGEVSEELIGTCGVRLMPFQYLLSLTVWSAGKEIIPHPSQSLK